MPAKTVANEFRQRFGNTISVANLPPELMDMNQRDCDAVALHVCQMNSFQGNAFAAIHKAFHVSPRAMAIRLVELELVTF